MFPNERGKMMKIPHITPITISVSECYLNCFQYYVLPGVGDENCHAAQRAGEYGFQRDTWKENRKFVQDAVDNFSAALYLDIEVVERPIKVAGVIYRWSIIDGGSSLVHGAIAWQQDDGGTSAQVWLGRRGRRLFAEFNKQRRRTTTMQWFRARFHPATRSP